MLTPCLRSSIFKFLADNKYIEQSIQKGYSPKLSGNLEHTAQMANIVKKARIKQRSLVITLSDLKNAFGEVHHNLLDEGLNDHHVSDHIKALVQSLYTDFNTSIIASEFNTPFIRVGRGVLQGDCLSPLLFNIVSTNSFNISRVADFFTLDSLRNLSQSTGSSLLTMLLL